MSDTYTATQWLGGSKGTRRVPRADPGAARLVFLSVLACILISAGLTAGPSSLRLLFPAFALLAAVFLSREVQTPYFLYLLVFLFLLTPLLRRLVDFRAGWESVNYLMLAPYAAGCVTLPILIRYKGRRGAVYWGCLTVIAASLYGCLIAVLNDRLQAGLLELLRWAIPPALALCLVRYLSGDSDRRIRIELLCLVAVPILSAYGIYQYVYAPPWDTLWITNSRMDSIGKPMPFQLRVFSTFNSPGSLGFFFLFGLTVLICSSSRLRWIGLSLGGAAFLLTLHRSAWLGLLIAMCWVFCLGGGRTRWTLVALAIAAFIAFPSALALPDVGQLLETRLESFTQLSTDDSLGDRSSGYEQLLEDLGEMPFGGGLGIAGSYQTADGAAAKVIDGGPIEILLSLGAIVGGLYMLAIIVVVARCLFFRCKGNPQVAGLQAVLLAQFVLLSSGTTTVGEIGLFFWIAVGMLEGERARSGKHY